MSEDQPLPPGWVPAVAWEMLSGCAVGLLAASSALLRGPGEVEVVDHVPERLDKAGELGATPARCGP